MDDAVSASNEESKMSTMLTGSEKQIAWAETIRAEILADEPALLAQMDKAQAMVDAGTAPAYVAPRLQATRARLAEIKAKANAGWWIEQRGVKLQTLLMPSAQGRQ